MKKVISLFVGVIFLLNCMAVMSFADGVPTAKITATLAGSAVPAVGEKFVVEISATEISTNMFASGEIVFSYPADVVTPVRYTKTEPTAVTNATQMIGGVTNKYSSTEETGKFSTISKIDLNAGTGAAAVYININAEDQAAEVLDDGTFEMFGFAFMLNEGYTYDDFYFSLMPNDGVCFLTADKKVASKMKDGNVTVEGIGEIPSNAQLSNIELQPSLLTMVNLQNTTQSTIESQVEDFETDLSILYNGKYYEAIVNPDNSLDVIISVKNNSDADNTFVCYIAEYNEDNSLLSFSKNDTITVLSGNTTEQMISHGVVNANTVLMKIFLWDNINMKPCTENVTLTMVANDYYADEFSVANSVETDVQICGTINVDSDIDILKLNPTVSGKYALKKSLTDNAAYNLYDSEQDVLTPEKSNGNYAVYNLLSGSSYYVKVTGNENNSYEINTTKLVEVTKNVGVSKNLNDAYDCDVFEFTPSESGEYIVTAVGTNAVDGRLYNQEFEQVKSSETDDSGVSFRITYEMEKDETYYIIVEQKTGQTGSFEYSLYIEEPLEIVSIQ